MHAEMHNRYQILILLNKTYVAYRKITSSTSGSSYKGQVRDYLQEIADQLVTKVDGDQHSIDQVAKMCLDWKVLSEPYAIRKMRLEFEHFGKRIENLINQWEAMLSTTIATLPTSEVEIRQELSKGSIFDKLTPAK